MSQDVLCFWQQRRHAGTIRGLEREFDAICLHIRGLLRALLLQRRIQRARRIRYAVELGRTELPGKASKLPKHVNCRFFV